MRTDLHFVSLEPEVVQRSLTYRRPRFEAVVLKAGWE